VLLAVLKLEIVPDSLESLEWFAWGVGAICVVAFGVGFLIAVVRIPFARRTVERRVLEETGAVVVEDDSEREVRNLLDGLAIAAGIPAPRFAVVEDPAPNAFSVGTRPDRALVAVTSGLIDVLSRDELEAVLAYEVVCIRSWDVALATWTVALTGEAIAALERDGGALSGIIGWIPRAGMGASEPGHRARPRRGAFHEEPERPRRRAREARRRSDPDRSRQPIHRPTLDRVPGERRRRLAVTGVAEALRVAAARRAHRRAACARAPRSARSDP
jgi:hypothetical protein